MLIAFTVIGRYNQKNDQYPESMKNWYARIVVIDSRRRSRFLFFFTNNQHFWLLVKKGVITVCIETTLTKPA